ncbi:MAG: hypothetical protein IKJ52_09980 [Muribaculaceae bacterium]|nr:hypothetical protein [Muribaculaceae bacterium]
MKGKILLITFVFVFFLSAFAFKSIDHIITKSQNFSPYECTILNSIGYTNKQKKANKKANNRILKLKVFNAEGNCISNKITN